MVISQPIQAGDTLKVTFTAEYDSAQFTPYVVLSNAANKYEKAGSGDYEVTFSAAETAAFVAGEYHYSVYVSDGTERYTIESGTVTVKADLTAGPVDARSTNKKILEAIEATIAGHATLGQQQTQINGKSILRYNPEDLIKLHARFKRLVREDDIAARFGGSTKKIYVRL